MKFHAFIYLSLFSILTTSNAIADIDDTSLLEKLRLGGHVVLMRHAITDFDQFDTHPVDLGNCDSQRNLSKAGREQSAAIGQAIRTLAIPVGKVFTSLFCRCIETAEIAFGKHESMMRLSSFMQESSEEKDRRVNYIKELLGTSPEPNTNTFLITHRYMLQQASGVELPEGGAAIFEPEGDSQFALVTVVPPERWQALVNLESVSPKSVEPEPGNLNLHE